MLVRHFVLFLLESQLYEISPRFSESTQINQWKPIYVSLPLNITNIYGKYRTKRPDSPQNTLQKDSNPLYDRQKKKSMTTTESLIEYKPQNFSKEPRNPWIPINVLQTNIRNHPTSPPTPYYINKLPRKSSTPVFKPIYIGSGGAYNNWNTFGYLTTKKEKIGYLPPLPKVYTPSSTSALPISPAIPEKGKQNTTLAPIMIKPVFDKSIFETRTTLKAKDDATIVTEQQTMSFSGTSTLFVKGENETGIDNNLVSDVGETVDMPPLKGDDVIEPTQGSMNQGITETNNVNSIFPSATTQTVVTQKTLAPIDSISLNFGFEKPTTPLVVPEEQLTTSTNTRMPISIKPVFEKALFDMITTSNPGVPSETETKTTDKKLTMIPSLGGDGRSEGNSGDVLENVTIEFIDMVSRHVDNLLTTNINAIGGEQATVPQKRSETIATDFSKASTSSKLPMIPTKQGSTKNIRSTRTVEIASEAMQTTNDPSTNAMVTICS